MRITNKIIQNNAINNVNINKILEDKLNTQLSTGSKISRPSDDPVIAIRALRLRTSLSQVQQYGRKNVPDATSWLKVTEAAIDTTSTVLTDMRKECVNGSTSYKTPEDRKKILDTLKALRDEIYATGDADYAGRYVFTGYRTDTSLTFGTSYKSAKPYAITEQLTKNAMDTIDYVNVAGMGSMTAQDVLTSAVKPADVEATQIHRIRLAYDNLDSAAGSFSVTLPDGSAVFAGGIQTVSANASPNAYDTLVGIKGDTDAKAVFVPETGELLLNDAAFNQIAGMKDDATTPAVNEGEIRITYSKSSFVANDLRPEHYFNCKTQNADGKMIEYNKEFLDPQYVDAQIINYDVGYNQQIRVNTMAKEVYTHDIGREVDEIISAIESSLQMSDILTDMKAKLEGATESTTPTKEQVQTKLDAVQKAYDLLEDKLQKAFESGITSMQGYLDRTSNALTECGSRQSRVDLVSNRLSAQETSFKELNSENEDADVAEVAIQLGSVEMSYQAALMATGKISQTSLLNYL